MKYDKFYNNVTDCNKYKEIVKKIKYFDIDKLTYDNSVDLVNRITISFNDEFLDFINELNMIESTILTEISIDILIDYNHLNYMYLPEEISSSLRGAGFIYKLYKLMIKKFGYITSTKDDSPSNINIWYHLMLDDDLYCYTSNFESGVILKTLSNSEIKEFLDKIKHKDLIFDGELKEKIVELYGSMENFKT